MRITIKRVLDRQITREQLQAARKIHIGQYDDLIYGSSRTRIWRSRVVANQVSLENYNGKCWSAVLQYTVA